MTDARFATVFELQKVSVHIDNKELNFLLAKNDHQTDTIRKTGYYEKYLTTHLIKTSDKRGYQNFIDIGANYGYHSIIFGTTIRPSGSILAFEPNPDVYPTLEKNIKLNSLENISLSNYAIGENFQNSKIYSSHSDTGVSSLGQIGHYDIAHEITVTSLDRELKKRSAFRCDLIKMDIQGHEFSALLGAFNSIEKHLPDIIIEFTPSEIPQNKKDLFQIFGFLAKNQYNPYLFRAHDFSANELVSFKVLLELFDLYRSRNNKGWFHIIFMSTNRLL